MARYYSVTFDAVALTAATDLFEITVAAEKPVVIWHWNVHQTTDLGDAAEEVLRLSLIRGVTAGTGGSAVTPATLTDDADTAAGATCNRTVTTASTGGTTIYGPRGWNIRIPEDHWFTPETAPRIDSAVDPVVLRMTAPADSITVGGTLIFAEI